MINKQYKLKKMEANKEYRFKDNPKEKEFFDKFS